MYRILNFFFKEILFCLLGLCDFFFGFIFLRVDYVVDKLFLGLKSGYRIIVGEVMDRCWIGRWDVYLRLRFFWYVMV